MALKNTKYGELTAWTVNQMIKGHTVTAAQLQQHGQPPRSVINYIRHIERVPVRTQRRVNCATPAERKLTAWDMTDEEIQRYQCDRLNQIADMTRQAEQRQHRNECRKAKQLLEKLGLDVPELIEAGAALFVPHIGEGKSQ